MSQIGAYTNNRLKRKEMNVKELRVGNLVLSGKKPKTFKIENGYNIEAAEFYLPIPMTEKHLLMFKFEYYGYLFDCKLYKKGIISVSVLKGIFTLSLKRDAKSNYIPLREFEHVHQLQNLYFALTQKELELKPQP